MEVSMWREQGQIIYGHKEGNQVCNGTNLFVSWTLESWFWEKSYKGWCDLEILHLLPKNSAPFLQGSPRRGTQDSLSLKTPFTLLCWATCFRTVGKGKDQWISWAVAHCHTSFPCAVCGGHHTIGNTARSIACRKRKSVSRMNVYPREMKHLLLSLAKLKVTDHPRDCSHPKERTLFWISLWIKIYHFTFIFHFINVICWNKSIPSTLKLAVLPHYLSLLLRILFFLNCFMSM